MEKITVNLMNVWNELFDWGFRPFLRYAGEIEITIYNSSDELNFFAATNNFNRTYEGMDKEFGERYYLVNGVRLIVNDPAIMD